MMTVWLQSAWQLKGQGKELSAISIEISSKTELRGPTQSLYF